MLRGEKMMRVTEDGRWGHRAWFAPCLIVGLLTMAVACPSVAEAAEGGGTDLDMPLRVLVAPSPPPPYPDPPPPPPLLILRRSKGLCRSRWARPWGSGACKPSR